MTRINRAQECASREEKFAGLRSILSRMAETGHPYAKRMAERGIRPDDVSSYEDLSLLPTTTKYDILNNYPLGWLAVDKKDVVRIHATNGSTGKPTLVAYTEGDLLMWARNMAWCMSLAGVNGDDIVQVSFAYGLFTGGFGFHEGASLLGAAVVPISDGFTDRQVSIMRDLGSSVLACTPSYALRLAEGIERTCGDGLSLRLGFFGAESWSDELRKSLESRLGIKAIDLYGLSEAMGPGVSSECLEQNGLHISDDFIAQTVDPKTLETLEDGSEGELVLTSWKKQAFPLVRYRTRDITSLMPGPCPCGEPTPRMARVRGRSDDMLIIRGVNVFPSQVEAAICAVPGMSPNFQISAWRDSGLQEMSIDCEMSGERDAEDIEAMGRDLAHSIKQSIGVTIPFEILPPGALQRTDGRAERIIKK
ncbi:MAG: phenylacetate--CoA ligase [Synergistaceae bacterium]|nr:phenylacetate--CoA ligase [Synergistaceae bacterium]